MRTFRYLVFLAVVFAVSGCVGSPSAPFEGSTNADSQLVSDTFETVFLHTKARGCSEIEKVRTTVTDPPSGEPGKRKSKERWVVFGCNERYPYEVDFLEDGQGGTYLTVTTE